MSSGEDGLRNERRRTRRKRGAGGKLPASGNLRRRCRGENRFFADRQFSDQNSEQKRQQRQRGRDLRIGSFVSRLLQLRAPITIAIRILRRVRGALEELQTGHILPGAVGSDGHPQHCENEAQQLQQSFHEPDRYLSQAPGTSRISFERFIARYGSPPRTVKFFKTRADVAL